MGQDMALLIVHYWDNQRFLPKASRFLGKDFERRRGITKGDPTSPVIFNMVVDVLGRSVLEIVCRPQEAQHRMGWATG